MNDLKKGTISFFNPSTIAYARVSSHEQKEDLERQQKMLEMYCSAQG